MQDSICSASDLACFLNVTERRIQQLANDNVIKRQSRGEYMFLASIQSYVRFIQEAAYGERASGTDLQAARARESKLKGDKLMLEIAEATRSMILVEDIEPALCTWATTGRQEVNSAFNKVIADIESRHEIDIDKDAVYAHILEALKAISNWPRLSAKSVIESETSQEESNHGN